MSVNMNEEIYQGLLAEVQNSEPISYALNAGITGTAEFQRAMEEASTYYANSNLYPERISPRTPEQQVIMANAAGDSHSEVFQIDINSLPSDFTEEDVLRYLNNNNVIYNPKRSLGKMAAYKKFSEKLKEKEEKNTLQFLDNLI